jgi:low affinity Fe/Cu permease
MFQNILHFFDKLEDKVRHKLSKRPVLYALIGGIAIVLFWRGVWHLADEWGMPAWVSFVVSVVIMMFTGTFVSFFIGEQILISGMREEKRIDEKTEEEIRGEEGRLAYIRQEIDEIRRDVAMLTDVLVPKKQQIQLRKEKPEQKIKIRVVK